MLFLNHFFAVETASSSTGTGSPSTSYVALSPNTISMGRLTSPPPNLLLTSPAASNALSRLLVRGVVRWLLCLVSLMVFSSWLVISGMLPVMSVLVVNVMSEGVTVTEPIRKKARKVNVFREKVASLLENVAFDLNDFGIEGRERMFARSERYRLCGQ